MDTTQKNREETRKRALQQGAKKTAQPRTQSAKKRPVAEEKQRAPRQASASPTKKTQKTVGSAPAAQKRSGTAKSAQRSDGARTAQTRKKQAPAQKKTTSRQTDLDAVATKRRAYGNSKPKKKTFLETMSEALQQKKTAPKSPEAKAREEARKAKARERRKQLDAPAVIYTQPQQFNRSRLMIQMVTVAAVVLAFVLGLSVFFKVETVTVSGAEVYSAWSVREASGISEGDNLLTFSRARAGAQIKANLPYVKSVRIGIKLPDTVNIMIEEEDVVYAIKDETGTWWLMNSNGWVVEQAKSNSASNYTQVLGLTITNPAAGEKAVASEESYTETNETGEAVVVTVTGAARLNAALQILQALEANDIVGDAASVDVSFTENIILWYGSQYQVNLGDTSQLENKIACMNDAILQMSGYQSGILDISFTAWADKVVYTPFE